MPFAVPRLHPGSLAPFAVAAFVALGAPLEVYAQESTAIDRFEPAPAGDDFSAVPSAAVRGWLRPAFALGVGYARAPLVLSDGEGATLREVVGHQLHLNVLASLALFDRGLFEVELPATLFQSGDPLTQESASFAEPKVASLGDLRVSGRIELVEQEGPVPSVAIAGAVRFPTAPTDAYAGTGNVRFTPRVSISADYGNVLWAIGGYRTVEPAETSGGNLLRDELGAEAAVAGRVAFAQIGAEAILTGQVGDGELVPTRSSLRFEPLASLRIHAGPVELSLLGGPGVARSPGTPSFRLWSSVGFAFDALAKPTAKDDAAGPSEGPRPSATAKAPPTSQGNHERPLATDKDRDGIGDDRDACPDEPGVPHPVREKHGCPQDSDGDTVLDREDACPNEPGDARPGIERRGCPAAIRTEAGRIVLLENVEFETAKATLLPSSDRVLEAVRAALAGDPTIVRVAVDGHTDARGAAAANLELSRARAVAVVRWLTDHGVDARRLSARGFGARQPIADNGSDAGRAKNRRVEFVILRRDPAGEAAWADGTLDEAPR